MKVIRQYQEREGILVFDSELDDSSSYEAHLLDTLNQAEKSHFWFSARREKICQVFDRFVDKKSSVLEIGGGTGYIAETLIKKGFSTHMADIHLNGLKLAQKRAIQNLYQFNLFYPPFENAFDVVCFFDVLEHLKEDDRALMCIQKMLKPGGKIIFTVPAHQWLWSRDDQIAGHKRRYTKKLCQQVLAKSGLKPLHMEYFFSAIVPFLYLRKLLRKDSGKPTEKDETVDLSIHPVFNQIFKLATKTEFFLQRHLPNKFGGSLLVVAQEPI